MAGSDQYKAIQFIEAIPGTGGIISTIAERVGCDWHTAKKYIERYVTIKRAYEDEIEHNVDNAESVVIQNIKYALEDQRAKKKPVDSSDAKWYLSRKGKHRGYSERHEVTGAEGGAVVIKYTGNADPNEL